MGFVSCDIIGHSTRRSATQLRRIRGINATVKALMERFPSEAIVWASGGDGGHVLLLHEGWVRDAVPFMVELRRWSGRHRTPLRIIGHYGPVDRIEGADGRVQPVGDGINTAGWILSRGSAEGFVVSEAFKDAASQQLGDQVSFHHPRQLQTDDGRAKQQLFLMSTREFQSVWASPVQSDHERLQRALDRGAPWEILYYAKRIMELNTADEKAKEAIHHVAAELDLTYAAETRGSAAKPNPLLGLLSFDSLLKFARSGELAERRYNEVLCRYGDEGDTMFVILRGQVGVFRPGGVDVDGDQPAAQHAEGEIVGELAFALKRKRTAELVALSEVALLAFNSDVLQRQLTETGTNQEAVSRIRRFVAERALEHTSRQVPYLLGRQRSGPLSQGGASSWRYAVDSLVPHTRVVEVPRYRHGLVELHPDDGQTQAEGIYILVGGKLCSSAIPEHALLGEEYPLLYVNLPGELVGPTLHFRVETDATLLRIARNGLEELPEAVRRGMVQELRRELRKSYFYDVFLSYNFEDHLEMERWRRALVDAGLRVRADIRQPGRPFREQIEAAILHARVLLVLASAHVTVRASEQNWVLEEVNFRKEMFAANPCILPVQLPDGRPDIVAPGISPVVAAGREPAAIHEAIETIKAIRDGQEDSPFDLEWRHGKLLGPSSG